jgi:hypothetical protein
VFCKVPVPGCIIIDSHDKQPRRTVFFAPISIAPNIKSGTKKMSAKEYRKLCEDQLRSIVKKKTMKTYQNTKEKEAFKKKLYQLADANMYKRSGNLNG